MIERLDLWLVDCWRTAWRWWSVQMHVVGTTLGALLLMVPAMPSEVQALLPLKARAIAVALWFALGLWLRLKRQKDSSGSK